MWLDCGRTPSESARLLRALHVPRRTAWAWAAALSGCAAASAAALLWRGAGLWAGWDPSRRNVYCEAVRWERGLRQAANAVSNAPFAAAGAHAAALGWADAGRRRATPQHSQLESHPAFSLLFGGALLLVAAGSWLFHASWSRAGQRLDMAGVYSVLLVPICFLALRLGLLGPRRAGGELAFRSAALAAAAAAARWKWRLKSATLVPLLVAVLAGLLALWLALGSPEAAAEAAAECEASLPPVAPTSTQRRWWLGPVKRTPPSGMAWGCLVGSAACAAAAFWATLADTASAGSPACHPHSPLQLHSLWHLCSAAALHLLYVFLRSEAPVE